MAENTKKRKAQQTEESRGKEMADNTKNEGVFAKLPQDIVFHILTKLPPTSLLSIRCVSKFFNSLISDPHFLNLHLAAPAAATQRHHLVYYKSTDYVKYHVSFHAEKTFSLCKTVGAPFKNVNGCIRLVGSCRGILCLFDTGYYTHVGKLILWNPFICKFKIVPGLPESRSDWFNVSHVGVGFGFSPKIGDFRVVNILYNPLDGPDNSPKAFVYDLKIGSWRMIPGQSIPCFLDSHWVSSVFVNGVVHWLAHKTQKFNGQQPDCILGFDLADEVFRSIELPGNIELNDKVLRLSPWVDQKSLALFVSHENFRSGVWDLWVMSYYGNVGSWNRVSTIVLNHHCLPIRVVNGGEVLASTVENKLLLVDVKKDEVKDLEIRGLPTSFCADGYVPSLALLENGVNFVE